MSYLKIALNKSKSSPHLVHEITYQMTFFTLHRAFIGVLVMWAHKSSTICLSHGSNQSPTFYVSILCK